MSLVTKICVSGGPSAGKSTLISECSVKHLSNLEQSVIVPDAYSILIEGGVKKESLIYKRSSGNLSIDYHRIMLELQIHLERSFYRIAKLNKEGAILICEKGRMEIYGYLPHKKVQELINYLHLSKADLRENAYDIAIVLATTADGNLQYFKKINENTSEMDIKQAIRFDKRLAKAWAGHPIMYYLDNKQKIDEKIKKGYNIIYKCINPSEEPRKRYKFQVNSLDEKELSSKSNIDGFDEYQVEIIFLKCNNPEQAQSIIKRKSSTCGNSYIHIVKQKASDINKKCRISGKEYFTFSDLQDKSKPIISYKEICFIIYPNIFIIQILPFTDPETKLLKIESEELETPLIPFFIQLKNLKNLSGDNSFKIKNLAFQYNKGPRKEDSKIDSQQQTGLDKVVELSKIKDESISQEN